MKLFLVGWKNCENLNTTPKQSKYFSYLIKRIITAMTGIILLVSTYIPTHMYLITTLGTEYL